MTGPGLRTSGSYGSLLLQQQVQNTCLSPIQTQPNLRKTSKMYVPGSREKEKFLQRICKFAGRRRVGMLLLVVVSVLVFMSVLSAVSKEEDASEVVSGGLTKHVENFRPNESMPSSIPGVSLNSGSHERKEVYNSSLQNNASVSLFIKANPQPPPVFHQNAPPLSHPCANFTFPPPPNDRKRTGPRPCPVCYLPVEQAMTYMPKEPSPSPVLKNLSYVFEENSVSTETFGGSEFGGYPTLKHRNDYFDIKESMHIHCGFVKGKKPGLHTGFDINETDLSEMENCRGIVVASAIFGNYDIIQQPKNISEASKQNVCFYMFIDEATEAYMRNNSVLGSENKVGFWRVIVVSNLPYLDARRNGKVPKLLLHRIFPNARYSIWIDGKLELVVDPYQILERFLWRSNATFAISRHYRRFDVFEEAEANKAAGKYDNSSIDYQIEFYKKEGLTHYSEAKLPITSDVPEGCVIIKEHIPITNLFTCLWFDEVDRFTSRDQISFSTVRDKIMSRVNWGINMFWDCERRNFVVQAYHRDLLEQMAPPPPPPRQVSIVVHPPPALLPESSTDRSTRSTPKKIPGKRGRERRSGSRRHRKVAAGSREINLF